MSIDLAMAAGVEGSSLVHSHTWYAQFGGHLAKLMYGIPAVCTVHSLEPMRPWKEEQLGGGYAVSSFCERTALEAADAIVAVSSEMRRDVLACYPAIDPDRVRVIYNGIDTEEYRPDPGTDVLERYGVDPVASVGRLRRQDHAPEGPRRICATPRCEIDPAAQLVLCAGAPDTPEIGAEIAAKVDRVRTERGNVIWLEQMLAKPEVIQLLSHATVFVCPSIYEPLGIVNLEAMACETAVVATRTGGIPEVVDDGVTGLLVPFEPRDDGIARAGRPGAVRDGHRRARQRAGRRSRRGRRRWAGRAGAARSSISPGARSPSRRSSCTARCSDQATQCCLVGAEADRPRLDRVDPEVRPVPRISRERGADGVVGLRLDGHHHAVLVGEWAAEDDEARADEPVHERGVLGPAGLLLERPRRIPLRSRPRAARRGTSPRPTSSSRVRSRRLVAAGAVGGTVPERGGARNRRGMRKAPAKKRCGCS